jgi:hypothetical protein
MKKIAEIREKIYNYFHSSDACHNFFFSDAQEERYAAYYTSMYLLQDTTESLMVHRHKGFSTDPFEAYIEFWDVMQAIIIQQDSICELHLAIKTAKLDWSNLHRGGNLGILGIFVLVILQKRIFLNNLP